MKSDELRQKFLDFFEKNGHKIVPSSSLLPSDPSVLFTTAGMQQFKQYYLGEESPYGKNVASCQKCIRTSDIDEVGDESHLTFFEMLGNFSFGGYFKEKAIRLAYEFIVKELGLKIDYVSVFKGDAKIKIGQKVPPDTDSEKIWRSLGVKDIRKFGRVDNFWGPTGTEGPCGPTTEIYVNGVEIWNIVFNEYYGVEQATNKFVEYWNKWMEGMGHRNLKLEKLKTLGVDTGMGLERLAMVVQEKETIFETDLFEPIIKEIEKLSGKKYEDYKKEFRIIVDHIKSSVFLISDGILPSNVNQGYVLRKLIRRTITYSNMLGLNVIGSFTIIVEVIQKIFKNIYPNLYQNINSPTHRDRISQAIRDEEIKSREALSKGQKEFEKRWAKKFSGKDVFNLKTVYSIPFELVAEWAREKGDPLSPEIIQDYYERFTKHQELSRTASAGMFKGGLADDKPETIKLHTAHHLLLAALQEVFGKTIKQKGSNINSERLRLDFSFDRKLTDEEKKKIENIVNEKIKEGLQVIKREMPKEEAEKIGAEMEFGVKYGNTVSIYFIEDKNGNIFSKEFCGGPHAASTSELGKFKIIKEEASGAGVRRIRAALE